MESISQMVRTLQLPGGQKALLAQLKRVSTIVTQFKKLFEKVNSSLLVLDSLSQQKRSPINFLGTSKFLLSSYWALKEQIQKESAAHRIPLLYEVTDCLVDSFSRVHARTLGFINHKNREIHELKRQIFKLNNVETNQYKKWKSPVLINQEQLNQESQNFTRQVNEVLRNRNNVLTLKHSIAKGRFRDLQKVAVRTKEGIEQIVEQLQQNSSAQQINYILEHPVINQLQKQLASQESARFNSALNSLKSFVLSKSRTFLSQGVQCEPDKQIQNLIKKSYRLEMTKQSKEQEIRELKYKVKELQRRIEQQDLDQELREKKQLKKMKSLRTLEIKDVIKLDQRISSSLSKKSQKKKRTTRQMKLQSQFECVAQIQPRAVDSKEIQSEEQIWENQIQNKKHSARQVKLLASIKELTEECNILSSNQLLFIQKKDTNAQLRNQYQKRCEQEERRFASKQTIKGQKCYEKNRYLDKEAGQLTEQEVEQNSIDSHKRLKMKIEGYQIKKQKILRPKDERISLQKGRHIVDKQDYTKEKSPFVGRQMYRTDEVQQSESEQQTNDKFDEHYSVRQTINYPTNTVGVTVKGMSSASRTDYKSQNKVEPQERREQQGQSITIQSSYLTSKKQNFSEKNQFRPWRTRSIKADRAQLTTTRSLSQILRLKALSKPKDSSSGLSDKKDAICQTQKQELILTRQLIDSVLANPKDTQFNHFSTLIKNLFSQILNEPKQAVLRQDRLLIVKQRGRLLKQLILNHQSLFQAVTVRGICPVPCAQRPIIRSTGDICRKNVGFSSMKELEQQKQQSQQREEMRERRRRYFERTKGLKTESKWTSRLLCKDSLYKNVELVFLKSKLL